MMTCRPHSLLAVLAAVSLCLALSACGREDDPDVDPTAEQNTMTTPTDPVDMEMFDACGTPPPDMTSGCRPPPNSEPNTEDVPDPYAARYQLLFTSLRFRPSVPSSAFLNNLLRQNLDQTLDTPIVVLLDKRNINAEAGTLELRTGAGVKTLNAGIYEWDSLTPRGYVDCTLDPATGLIKGVIPEFIFIATIGMGADAMGVPLIVNDLQFEATIKNSADVPGEVDIEVGYVKGHMTKSNGDKSMVDLMTGNPPITITALFKEETMNFDADSDGINDSWELEADFKATPTQIR